MRSALTADALIGAVARGFLIASLSSEIPAVKENLAIIRFLTVSAHDVVQFYFSGFILGLTLPAYDTILVLYVSDGVKRVMGHLGFA